MRTLIQKSLLALTVVAALSAHSLRADSISNLGDDSLVHFSIESIFCSGGDCVKILESAVSEIEGVTSVKLNVEEHRFEIKFDDELVSESDLFDQTAEITSFDLVVLPKEDADVDTN